jgi:hypothetical protein
LFLCRCFPRRRWLPLLPGIPGCLDRKRHEHCPYLDHLTLGDPDLRHGASHRRRHFDHGFIGLDVQNDLALLDGIAFGNAHLQDFCFVNPFPRIWESKCCGHTLARYA